MHENACRASGVCVCVYVCEYLHELARFQVGYNCLTDPVRVKVHAFVLLAGPAGHTHTHTHTYTHTAPTCEVRGVSFMPDSWRDTKHVPRENRGRDLVCGCVCVCV